MSGKIWLSALSSAAVGSFAAARSAASDYAHALSEWESSLGFIRGHLYKLGVIDPPVRAGFSPHSLWVGAGVGLLAFAAVYTAFIVIQAFLEKEVTDEP